MRHHKAHRKLGRERNQRKALLRTLAVSLILKEKIKTTEARAKELRPYAERLVTYGKKNTIAGRRAIQAAVGLKPSEKLFKTIAPRYSERHGGYVRILRLAKKGTDGGTKAIIEFV